jgi:hypothetical protein
VAFSPEGNTLASGAGSGTGELRGISGTGGFQSSGETTTYTLDYTPRPPARLSPGAHGLSPHRQVPLRIDSRRVASQSRQSRVRPMLAQFTVGDLVIEIILGFTSFPDFRGVPAGARR